MLLAEDPLEPLRTSGIRTDPAFSRSRATVLSDSGGSFICEASVGSDQSDGVALKNMEGVWARTPVRYCEVVVLSRDVRVYVVSEERLTEEEVLSLGGDETSSTVPSEAMLKWPSRPERLNFQVDEDEESIEVSEGALCVGRGANKEEVMLGARLLSEFLEALGKMEGRLGLGLSSRTEVVGEVDILRLWVRLRAKVRNGDGVLKVMVLPRLLRGVVGALERSMTCWACCTKRGWLSMKTRDGHK